MRCMGLIGAISLVVAVNGIVLAGVIRNRTAPPEATLVMTERELWLPVRIYRLASSDENSGVSLQLNWEYAVGWDDAFDSDRLRALGFNPGKSAPSSVKSIEPKVPLPRYAYAVLEYDGPAWSAVLRNKEQLAAEEAAKIAAGKLPREEDPYAQSALRRARISDSHLVLIDIGEDPRVLRTRYTDPRRYLIAPAEVRLIYSYSDESVYQPKSAKRGARISASILTGSVTVPVQFQVALRAVTGTTVRRPYRIRGGNEEIKPPRYQVTLRVGHRYEPWIAELTALSDEQQSSPGHE